MDITVYTFTSRKEKTIRSVDKYTQQDTERRNEQSTAKTDNPIMQSHIRLVRNREERDK